MRNGIEELKCEYRKKVKGCSSEKSKEHWEWYLKERWLEDGYLGIFREIQTGQLQMHNRGLEPVYAYLAEELTHAEFFQAVREQVFDGYAQALLDNSLIDEELDATYYKMTEELGLETIKAFKELRGMEIPGPDCPKEIATAAATIWYHFVTLLHKMWTLPPVSALDGHLYITRPYERAVFDSGYFDTYELTPEERAELKELVGINRLRQLGKRARA